MTTTTDPTPMIDEETANKIRDLIEADLLAHPAALAVWLAETAEKDAAA